MLIMKALIPSTILTLIVSAVVGSSGSRGNFLNLQDFFVAGHAYYWSWPFFMTVMALNSLIILRIQRSG